MGPVTWKENRKGWSGGALVRRVAEARDPAAGHRRPPDVRAGPVVGRGPGSCGPADSGDVEPCVCHGCSSSPGPLL